MNNIVGYKGFTKDLKDKDGNDYRCYIPYRINGDIKFDKNGYHIYSNIEDAYLFTDAKSIDDTAICKVTGYGNIEEGYDRHHEIYGSMYVASDMIINGVLGREEIIEMILNSNELIVRKFISIVKLSKEEEQLFRERFRGNQYIERPLDYYCLNDTDVYKRTRKK